MSRERTGGLVFLLISVFYGWGATRIPSLPVDATEAMNARSLPYLLTALGIAMSLALMLRKDAATAEATTEATPAHWSTALALLALVVAYALLLDWLGFLACTGLFLFAGFGLLGERRWLRSALVAAGLVLTLWGLLVTGLGIYLAPGRLWSVGLWSVA